MRNAKSKALHKVKKGKSYEPDEITTLDPEARVRYNSLRDMGHSHKGSAKIIKKMDYKV